MGRLWGRAHREEELMDEEKDDRLPYVVHNALNAVYLGAMKYMQDEWDARGLRGESPGVAKLREYLRQ